MEYSIDNNKIIFNRYINLNKGYIADLNDNIALKYKRGYYLIVLDFRAIDDPNLNILPAKIIYSEYKETTFSYKFNMTVLKEFEI